MHFHDGRKHLAGSGDDCENVWIYFARAARKSLKTRGVIQCRFVRSVAVPILAQLLVKTKRQKIEGDLGTRPVTGCFSRHRFMGQGRGGRDWVPMGGRTSWSALLQWKAAPFGETLERGRVATTIGHIQPRRKKGRGYAPGLFDSRDCTSASSVEPECRSGTRWNRFRAIRMRFLNLQRNRRRR